MAALTRRPVHWQRPSYCQGAQEIPLVDGVVGNNRRGAVRQLAATILPKSRLGPSARRDHHTAKDAARFVSAKSSSILQGMQRRCDHDARAV
jgi:hypothetical protein